MAPILPGSSVPHLFTLAASVAAGAATYFALAAAPFELPAGLLEQASFAATRSLERDWVDRALPADYLPTLVVETPCRLEDPPDWAGEVFATFRRGDDAGLARLAAKYPGSWLPPLLWSELLLGRGEKARALEVLASFTRGPRYKAISESSYLPPDDQRGMIHFWHRYAYLQHETNSRDPKLFWQSLKNPIGRVKVLSNSGQSELPKDAPSWDEHHLRAPGCDDSRLTSFDLYNNLLVAYLEAPGFKETDRRRNAEFARSYHDKPAQNPLLAALGKARKTELDRREGFVWAISNAERLLRDRAANGRDLPSHPELALNLALLSAEAARLVPEQRGPFWKQIGGLMEKAAAGGADAPLFAGGLTRLRLLRQIEAGAFGAVPAPPQGAPEAQEATSRVNAATAARRDPVAAKALLAKGRELPELGAAASDWLAALRQDLAATLVAKIDPEAPLEQRQAASRLAHQALAGDPAPAALTELDATLPWSSRLAAAASGTSGRVGLALLVAALVFALALVVARELRFRNYLFTNFYRREAEGFRRS